jgi:hypothetical protein
MGLRKVGSAMRAESRAVLATQGRERHSKQEPLSHHGEKVDLVVLDFVCIGVVGSLLVHLIEVYTHALNEWRKASPTHTSPRGRGCTGNMNARGKRFEMDRDVNGRVNYPRVIKFKVKNGDGNVDVFSCARAAQ